jgi:hypothetical protein
MAAFSTVLHVKDLFIARAARTSKVADDPDSSMGIVGSDTDIRNDGWPLDLTATVENVVVAGLGADDSGRQIQQIDRLFSIMAGGWVSDGVGDVKNTPMFHLTFKNWDLGGNGVWSPSEMCNYGQPRDWKLKLEGKELNDNYDKNNMCPSSHAW